MIGRIDHTSQKSDTLRGAIPLFLKSRLPALSFSLDLLPGHVQPLMCYGEATLDLHMQPGVVQHLLGLAPLLTRYDLGRVKLGWDSKY